MIHQPKIAIDNHSQLSHVGREHGDARERIPCGSRWFVVQTHSQAETWAELNLKRQGYVVFVPRETVLRRDRVLKTMTHKVEIPCFPGYGFVRFDPDNDPWRPIVSTRGIKKLFCTMSERPMPVRIGDVERLIADADARRIVDTELPPIEEGTQLEVTAGPFAERSGLCVWSNSKRTRLLMPVLGAEIVVEVARGAVRAK